MPALNPAKWNEFQRDYAQAHPGAARDEIRAAYAVQKAGGSSSAPIPEESTGDPQGSPIYQDQGSPIHQDQAPPPLESEEQTYYRQVLQASGADDVDDGKFGKFTIEPLAFMWEALFSIFAGVFGPWWALTPKEASRIARAWRAWVKSLPKRQAQFLLRLERDVMPTLSLAGTVMGIVVPRWEMTTQARRGMLTRQGPVSRATAPTSFPQAAAQEPPVMHGPARSNGGPRTVAAGSPGHDPFAEEIAEEIERGEVA